MSLLAIIVPFGHYCRFLPSLVATFETPIPGYSGISRNRPEGEMDPFLGFFENLLKVDKRHAIKASIDFLKSEPALDFSGFP